MEDILSHCKNPRALEQVRAHRKRVAALLDRGVTIPCPEAIEVSDDIDMARISPHCILHAGTKIGGPRTAIGPGSELGREGPVALENTVLGAAVKLDGGYFENATFLDGAEARAFAHIRNGTLLEEKASVAHCVGLKQTILFPFVTLGSLINFCDCLMAGGSSRTDHSEVGSGYIHFNFTPRGDKATASLFGDVPRGVLLDQPRIFLGGMAGSVGPLKVGYGSFLGPGAIYRRDVREGRFILSEKPIQIQMEFDPAILTGLRVKMRKTATYVGNLAALWHWYRHIRVLFNGGGREMLYDEAQASVAGSIQERIKQFGKLIAFIPQSVESLKRAGAADKTIADQQYAASRWIAIRDELSAYGERLGRVSDREKVVHWVASHARPGQYVEVIQTMPTEVREAATAWLLDIVTSLQDRVKDAFDGDATQ